MSEPKQIFTIGHSTRPIETFMQLLMEWEIEEVADVRRFPGSRRNPQFGWDALTQALGEHDIGYRHHAELGGRRGLKRASPSTNSGWRVAAFRAYADHTATAEWLTAFHDLETAAAERRNVIMCAEATPWRCHRRLISDALVVRGWSVFHIMTEARADQHVLPDFARVDEEGGLSYPAAETEAGT